MNFYEQGLQSIHGLTEIITYLVRLVINCMALLCVIPTALRWRRERQILSQLENLANRLQMTAPANVVASLPPAAASAALSRINESMRKKTSTRKRRLSQAATGYDNPGFVPINSTQQNSNHQPQITLPIFPYLYGMYPSQNEFNASIFGLDPSQIIGPVPQMPSKYFIQIIFILFVRILTNIILFLLSYKTNTILTRFSAYYSSQTTTGNKANNN